MHQHTPPTHHHLHLVFLSAAQHAPAVCPGPEETAVLDAYIFHPKNTTGDIVNQVARVHVHAPLLLFCLYVCLCLCSEAEPNAHTHTHAHKHKSTHTHMHENARTQAQTRTHTHTQMRAHTRWRGCLHLCRMWLISWAMSCLCARMPWTTTRTLTTTATSPTTSWRLSPSGGSTR